MAHKHTQGEWYVDSENKSNGIIDIEKAFTVINDEWHIAAVWTDVGEQGEPEANARLIAAAPDLLEALEHGLRLAESLQNKNSIAVKMFINAAKAAIQKATL